MLHMQLIYDESLKTNIIKEIFIAGLMSLSARGHSNILSKAWTTPQTKAWLGKLLNHISELSNYLLFIVSQMHSNHVGIWTTTESG